MTVPFGNKIFRKDCRISEMRSYGLFVSSFLLSRLEMEGDNLSNDSVCKSRASVLRLMYISRNF